MSEADRLRVIVTRPALQAAGWVENLQRHDIAAVALPLLAIAAPPDAAAVVGAWATLADRRLVVFVSPNAAQAFFDQAPPGSSWPSPVQAASPGPGTTAVLGRLGVPPARIVEPAAEAAQLDSETLWAALEAGDWQGASVLVVRGSSGRDWLSARLRERGAQVEHVTAYVRTAAPFGIDERRIVAAASAEPRRHVWLFSSAEAIDHLAAFAASANPGAALPWPQARAIATHPRIAARAQQLGFGEVSGCRPLLAAVIACIQSLRP